MPSKRTFTIILALTAGIVIITTLSLLYLLNQEKTHPAPPSEISTSSIRSLLDNSPLNIEQVEFAESVYYEFQGSLLTPLYFRNDVLMGDMIIDDDPNNTPIHLIVGIRGGQVRFGQSTGDSTSWNLASPEQVFEQSQNKTSVIVRVIASFSVPADRPDYDYVTQQRKINQEVQTMASRGTSALEPGYTINTDMFGVQN